MLLLFLLVALTSADLTFYDRILILTTESQDAQPLDLVSVADPTQDYAVNSGLYTRAQAQELKSLAIAYFKDQFGLDWTNAPVIDALGGMYIPQGLLYTYVGGNA